MANDYSVNSGVFRDSGNYVKEYANLCSATALYLLALQSEELTESQRQEMVKKCESFIKLQEEIEETRFSIETLSFSPAKRKRKKNSKYDNEAFTSYNPPESIVEKQTIDVKEVILAAQQAEQTYYRYLFFYLRSYSFYIFLQGIDAKFGFEILSANLNIHGRKTFICSENDSIQIMK